jgi:hypothetical protein
MTGLLNVAGHVAVLPLVAVVPPVDDEPPFDETPPMATVPPLEVPPPNAVLRFLVELPPNGLPPSAAGLCPPKLSTVPPVPAPPSAAVPEVVVAPPVVDGFTVAPPELTAPPKPPVPAPPPLESAEPEQATATNPAAQNGNKRAALTGRRFARTICREYFMRWLSPRIEEHGALLTLTKSALSWLWRPPSESVDEICAVVSTRNFRARRGSRLTDSSETL